MKCEKQQAQALAEYLEAARRPPDRPTPPSRRRCRAAPAAVLEWVGGHDEHRLRPRPTERLLLDVEELARRARTRAARPDDPASCGSGSRRARSPRYVAQARALAAAGRPLCRLCGQPIDPSGHACPRLN